MNAIKSFREGDMLLKIFIDYDAENPRDWYNIGTMICSHNRYKLGDTSFDSTKYNSWEEVLQGEVYDKYGVENVAVLPLYLYDHSGITMNTTGFHCRWDSGQVGWIYVTKEKLLQETGYTEEKLFQEGKALDILKAEVEEYDNYLKGNVYGYKLYKVEKKCECCQNENSVLIDSCWGFYGNDLIKNGMINQVPQEFKKILEEVRYI